MAVQQGAYITMWFSDLQTLFAVAPRKMFVNECIIPLKYVFRWIYCMKHH